MSLEHCKAKMWDHCKVCVLEKRITSSCFFLVGEHELVKM